VSGDGKLNASLGSPVLLHKHGRHPHAENEDDSSHCTQEEFKRAETVGVPRLTTEWGVFKQVAVSVPAVADFAPFVRRIDDSVLESVDEFCKGDITVMTKDVEGLEPFAVGTVLELQSDEVTGVGGWTFDELDDHS